MTKDEEYLHELVRSLENAWNAANHVGFTAPFADDAIFVHIFGGQLDGRQAIEEAYQFNGMYKGSRNQYAVLSISFVRADVAIVLLQAHLRFQADGDPREIHARHTLIAAKEDGRWVVQMFQNAWISDMPGAQSTSNQ